MRALVIGGDGTIGRALTTSLRASRWEVYATSRRADRRADASIQLDLSADGSERTLLPAVDVVFFCAAVTGFANCAANPDVARKVNVSAPVAIARRIASFGSRVVLLSTSAVFGGQGPRVRADHPVSPTTLYGRLKADAESAFLSLGDKAAVLRLTKVLHPDLPLLREWTEVLAAGRPVRALSDLAVAPISLRSVVESLVIVGSDKGSGVYQASARSEITYADAARRIAENMGLAGDLVIEESGADRNIPREQLALSASLDTTRLDRLSGIDAPDPLNVVDEVSLSMIARVVEGPWPRRVP